VISNFFLELNKRILFVGIIATGIVSSLILNSNDVIARTYTQDKPSIPESPEEIAAGKVLYENVSLLSRRRGERGWPGG
jgi:hypothetical protein